ncbi:MAG: ABC transporter permease [Candidatus Micrarchaeia archaeon]
MDIAEIINFSLKNVLHRKLRSFLTILGIVVGIATIVILLSLSLGIEASIVDSVQSLGSNYVMVLPTTSLQSGTFNKVLYTKDADALRRLPGVDAVAGEILVSNAPIQFRRKITAGNVAGSEIDVYVKYTNASGVTFRDGGYFRSGDKSSIVIGSKVADEYFDDKVYVGNSILINNRSFRVSGIFNKSSGAISDLDDTILMEATALRELFPSAVPKDQVFDIFITVSPKADPEAVAKDVTTTLARRRKVDPDKPDFTVMTAASTLEQIRQVTGILSVFLGFVALIALVVGAIGISNAMFTSVMERTKDIGIMKAVGAPNNQILQMFLIESVLVSGIGGLIGIIIGSAISLLVSALVTKTVLNAEVLVGAMSVSLFFGAVSGYFPAKQASKLPAVVALRRD